MTETRRQQLLHALVDTWDHQFDPITRLLPAPAGSSDNLHYALALLETAERSRMGRAEALTAHVIATWPPSSPAGFALPLFTIWQRHRARLSSALQIKIENSFKDTSALPRQPAASPEPPSTNHLLKHADSIFVAVYQSPPQSAKALARFNEFADTVESIHPGELFPPELIHLLFSLHAIESCIQEPDITDRLSAVCHRLWNALEHLSSPRPLAAEMLIERAALTSAHSISIEDFKRTLQQSPRDIPDILQSLVVSLNLPCLA